MLYSNHNELFLSSCHVFRLTDLLLDSDLFSVFLQPFKTLTSTRILYVEFLSKAVIFAGY